MYREMAVRENIHEIHRLFNIGYKITFIRMHKQNLRFFLKRTYEIRFGDTLSHRAQTRREGFLHLLVQYQIQKRGDCMNFEKARYAEP